MTPKAGHRNCDRHWFDFGALVDAAVPQLRACAFPRDDELAARAIASAGIAALVGLPFLMLSSMVFDAPLAVPAAIASGYLALSQALASHNPRRAKVINAAVLCGLVGWLLFFLLGRNGAISHAGLSAALMAPLFAAAPALARSIIAQRADFAARDEAVPEPVAHLDRDNIGISKRQDYTSLRTKEGPSHPETTAVPPRGISQRPICDLGEAIDFALARAAPKAVAREIRLSPVTEPNLAVGGDRQLVRRIVCLLVDAALAEGRGSIVRVAARKLKGVALLRVTTGDEWHGSDGLAAEGEAFDVTILRELVESMDGTLVVDRGVCGAVFSVRLRFADETAAEERVGRRADAG